MFFKVILLFLSVVSFIFYIYELKTNTFISKSVKLQQIKDALDEKNNLDATTKGIAIIFIAVATILGLSISLFFTILACTVIGGFIFTIISILLFLFNSYISIRFMKNVYSNPEKVIQSIPIKIGMKVIDFTYLGYVLYFLYKSMGGF